MQMCGKSFVTVLPLIIIRAGTSSGKVNVFFLFPRLSPVINTLKHVYIKRVERPLKKTSHTDANLPPNFPHASISGRRPGGQIWVYILLLLKLDWLGCRYATGRRVSRNFLPTLGQGFLLACLVGKADRVGKGGLVTAWSRSEIESEREQWKQASCHLLRVSRSTFILPPQFSER